MRWALPPGTGARPSALALAGDEVHVWRAGLDVPVSVVQHLEAILSADELARAARFFFRVDRDRFVVGRGVLRTILGQYLDVEPGRLRFAYGPHGKPALAPARGGDGLPFEALHFNVAHADGLALYAIARGRQLGVDVERIRAGFDTLAIATRFFSPGEVAALRALPPDRQDAAFFACWTRKEAYVKARGDGLACRLDQFDVSLAPGEPAALLRIGGDPAPAGRWSLCELDPAPGYAGALAVVGRVRAVECWQWPGP